MQQITGTPVFIIILEVLTGDILYQSLDALDAVKRVYDGDKMDRGGTVFFPRAQLRVPLQHPGGRAMTAPSFMDRFGARLIANGYPIIPIQPGTKKPGCHRGGGWRDYPDWTRHAARATTELELAQWRGWPDAGIGIVGGAVAAVDIDIADDAELAHRIERLARERLGDTPALRIGRPPKRLLVYRTAAPFKGIKRHPLEVLCLGQQFVAYAIHPATGRPYEWPEENLADLDLEQPAGDR